MSLCSVVCSVVIHHRYLLNYNYSSQFRSLDIGMLAPCIVILIIHYLTEFIIYVVRWREYKVTETFGAITVEFSLLPLRQISLEEISFVVNLLTSIIILITVYLFAWDSHGRLSLLVLWCTHVTCVNYVYYVSICSYA